MAEPDRQDSPNLSDEDDTDMDVYLKIADKSQAGCNVLINRLNFLSSKHIVAEHSADEIPRHVKNWSGVYKKTAEEALCRGIVETQVYGQALMQVAEKQPSLENNSTLLDTTVYKQIWTSLESLVGSSGSLTELTDNLKEKRAQRDKVVLKYRKASQEMDERLAQDMEKLKTLGSNEKQDIDWFAKHYRKRLDKLATLQLVALMLVSKGNINYVENPQFVLLMKKLKKPYSAEKILEDLRSESA